MKYSTYLNYQKNNSPASVYDFPLTRSAWVFDQLKREESTIEALCERNTALEAKKTNLILFKGRSLSTFAINLFFLKIIRNLLQFDDSQIGGAYTYESGNSPP